MENTEQIGDRITDWNSVLELVERLRFFRTGNFDLHISKRAGHELKVKLEDHNQQIADEAHHDLPVKFMVGLHDLFW